MASKFNADLLANLSTVLFPLIGFRQNLVISVQSDNRDSVHRSHPREFVQKHVRVNTTTVT
jgi:hypothetical protein